MKKTFISELKRIFPHLPVVILAVAANLTAYLVPQFINLFRPLVVFTTPLDEMTPFIPVFVVSYVGAFIQWVVYYIRLAAGEKAPAYRFLSGEIMGKLVAMIFFIVFPLTMSRPGITGTGFFSWACSVIFTVDNPVCLFPSIHCMQSWLCMRYIMTTREPSFYKVLCIMFSVSVFMSTVLIKQHLIGDVVSGILVAEACLFVADHSSLPDKLEDFTERLKRKGRKDA